jgi:hypothetical protein
MRAEFHGLTILVLGLVQNTHTLHIVVPSLWRRKDRA